MGEVEEAREVRRCHLCGRKLFGKEGVHYWKISKETLPDYDGLVLYECIDCGEPIIPGVRFKVKMEALETLRNIISGKKYLAETLRDMLIAAIYTAAGNDRYPFNNKQKEKLDGIAKAADECRRRAG